MYGECQEGGAVRTRFTNTVGEAGISRRREPRTGVIEYNRDFTPTINHWPPRGCEFRTVPGVGQPTGYGVDDPTVNAKDLTTNGGVPPGSFRLRF
jgi:hypothetical protein